MKTRFLPAAIRSAWFALTWILLQTAVAHAQGTFIARSYTATSFPRIIIKGHPALPSDNVWVEILVPQASSISGLAATPFPLTFTTEPRVGGFSMGTVTVNGIAAGQTVKVIVRAWDKDTGLTFDTAKLRAAVTVVVPLGGDPGNGVPPFLSRTLGECGYPGMTLQHVP